MLYFGKNLSPQKGRMPLNATALEVCTLGGFTIRRGDRELNVSGRSRKLCLLLAFLISRRERPVPYEELIELLWDEDGRGANSFNALKGILHRARGCLDQLEKGAGRTLILSREGGCQWNDQIPLTLDCERFLQLLQNAGQAQREDRRLSLQLDALALYCGDFLPALSGCPWAAEQTEMLHRLYLQTTLEVLPRLEAAGRWEQAAQTAGDALALEPCHEELCRQRMEALLRLERQREAILVYEAFQDRLLNQLGVMPSDRLRELYRQAHSLHNPRAISAVTLLERLQEPPQPGALLCDFDFFRVICHSMARRAGRSGEPLHIALLSLAAPEGRELARHSLDRAMDNLQALILTQLRRGDAAARCSISQFVLRLPQSGYENSRMVCQRIVRAFVRQYPHSPVVLQFTVQPVPAGS